MSALATYRPLAFEVEHFANQDAINRLIGDAAEASIAATLIRVVADHYHAEFPQYAGHWDGPQWKLVRFTQDVATKGGLRFAVGDYAIADLTPEILPFCSVGAPTVTAYSTRGHVNCSVLRTAFEVVA